MAPACYLLLVAFLLSGCGRSSGPTIVLDRWWTIDYAKLACAQLAPKQDYESCLGEVRTFESELVTQLAATAACNSVRVFVYGGEGNSTAYEAIKAGGYWNLSFNFVPGERNQKWVMLGPNRVLLRKGQGDPTQIAKAVCVIVTRQGATIASPNE